MNHNIYLYILVMAGVTYLIRMLPLVLMKKEITKASVCKRLINPNDCNPKCAMGYDLKILIKYAILKK